MLPEDSALLERDGERGPVPAAARLAGTPRWAASGESAATNESPRRGRPSYGNQLSPRERQIADLAAAGHTNRDIAAILYVSDCTVKYHIANVMRKLEITSRRQLRDVLDPEVPGSEATSSPDHICRCSTCGRELTHPHWLGNSRENRRILKESRPPHRQGEPV